MIREGTPDQGAVDELLTQLPKFRHVCRSGPMQLICKLLDKLPSTQFHVYVMYRNHASQ